MATERTFSIIKPDATERNLTGAVNAVIEQAGLRTRMEELALTDPLTGLASRRIWEEELPRELARARRSGDAVSHLVARFNAEGLAATSPRHGGGHPVVYGPAQRQRILAEVNRPPTPEADGTATWSLGTLRKALRSTPGGLPAVSTYTLWRVLHGAGYSHQQTRTWCPTGTALRRRKAGPAVVTDPDAGHRTLLPGEEPAEGGVRMRRGGTLEADRRLGAAAWPPLLDLIRGGPDRHRAG